MSGASPRELPQDDEWTVTTPTEFWLGPAPRGVGGVGVHPRFRIAPPACASTGPTAAALSQLMGQLADPSRAHIEIMRSR
jgi:hypothetical protein